MLFPQVLNRYKLQPGDEGVYIGRPSKWQNPFPMTPSMTRDQVCDAFDAYLQQRPELMQAAKQELKGKNLICFCTPHRCHGDALVRLANGSFVGPTPFEHYRMLRPLQTWGYHVANEEDNFSMATLRDERLFYCDTDDWSSPWIKGNEVFRIDFSVTRPLVLLEQKERFEYFFDGTEATYRKKYDSVVYTPTRDKRARHVRQGVLFDPKRQITAITRVTAETHGR